MYMFMCEHVCGAQRLMLDVFLNNSFFLRLSFCEPGVTDLQSLAGHHVPGIFLSLSIQLWDYRHALLLHLKS